MRAPDPGDRRKNAVSLTADGQRLLKRCEKAAHSPPGRDAVLARDGLRLLMACLKRTRGGLREQLRQEAAALTEFDSVTGKLTWQEGMAVRSLFLVHLAQGKTDLVATLTGDEK